jgi:uncharacterized protein
MKKAISTAAAVVLVFLLSVCALAVGEEYIHDNAGLLNESNKAGVTSFLKQLNINYGVNMYIVTRNSKNEKGSLSALQYSENFCAENGLEEDGGKGLLAVFDAGNQTSFFYEYGGDIFTDSFISKLSLTVESFYPEGDFYMMCRELAALTDDYLYEELGFQNLPRVVDNAQLLSNYEEESLLKKIGEIRSKYDFEVVIITTDGIGNKTIEEYADDTYDYGNYGCGTDKDGMLFVINMGERDYYTSTCGYGITAFTDYGIEQLHENVVPLLTGGSYFAAFDAYLDNVSIFLEQAKKGKPFDVPANPKKSDGDTFGSHTHKKTADEYLKAEAVVVAISLAAAVGIALFVRSGMNSAVIKRSATDYIKTDGAKARKSKGSDCGVNLRKSADIFIYSTTTKTKKETSSSSGGGGSSTHIGSSGSTHGGGGGKF